MQKTTTYLLIALLLICPYFCWGEVAGAVSSPCLATACSCPNDSEQSDGETPGLPVDYDHDCLCQGAIMDGQLRTAELDDVNPLVTYWLVDDGTSSSLSPSLASITFEPPHQFPPYSSGRDVCALTCALLL